jgi:hypothetical protein
VRTRFQPRFLEILYAILLGLIAVHAASAQVVVGPTGASAPIGSTRQFTATVGGAPASGVIWAVNGQAGGDGTNGTISPTGLYAAPSKPPAGYTVTISATVGSATGSVPLIVREQIPWLTPGRRGVSRAPGHSRPGTRIRMLTN